ncbi:uncharacterized protein PGTG_09397 [Puccinia graminis f. sp. tritici CRL 75-36-700-3]|uniref:Uncharacterized protein n=1 Tax=Puccinia graminis f. sp. tritici (strain CRL 75-36-700-3 / race SCCL) TaxID=418459 RepID=E3KHA9_PUCGT|nr:uncharacterized protein PGTG_09397 [Puccinia graminis f. sp. tritici CRL 75-36-700-3]EFP83684.1 hypothetical protein PGTG_09397 [Puccinia graminis f. sp. tritici CRL 75-36-700-3]
MSNKLSTVINNAVKKGRNRQVISTPDSATKVFVVEQEVYEPGSLEIETRLKKITGLVATSLPGRIKSAVIVRKREELANRKANHRANPRIKYKSKSYKSLEKSFTNSRISWRMVAVWERRKIRNKSKRNKQQTKYPLLRLVVRNRGITGIAVKGKLEVEID